MKPNVMKRAPAAAPRDTLLLLLPEDPGAAVDWWRLDPTGRCVDRGTGSPGPGGPALRVVAGVAGAGCAVHRVQVRAHSLAQATAAARATLAAGLAGNDDVHVAVAADGDAWWAAVAAVADVQRCLERVRALGLEPEHMVPAALLLPPPGDVPGTAGGGLEDEDGAPVLIARHRQDWLCRGAGLAFTAEEDLARTILAGRPMDPVPLDAELLAAGALAPPLDLLQGPFAPASHAPRGAAAWRRSAVLATAVLAMLLLAPGIRAGIDQWQAGRLLDQAMREAREAVPGAATGPDALTALRGRVAASRNVLDFSAATGGLMASVQAVPGTSLDALSWRDGRLQATVAHGGTDDVDALRTRLAAHGFGLVEESRSVDGGDHLRISLEPMQ